MELLNSLSLILSWIYYLKIFVLPRDLKVNLENLSNSEAIPVSSTFNQFKDNDPNDICWSVICNFESTIFSNKNAVVWKIGEFHWYMMMMMTKSDKNNWK